MEDKSIDKMLKRKAELETKYEELNKEEKELMNRIAEISYKRVHVWHELEELSKEIRVKKLINMDIEEEE